MTPRQRDLGLASVLLVLAAFAMFEITRVSANGSRTATRPPGPVVTRPSWNPDVHRRAVLTSIERVIGNQVGTCGGGTWEGGGFANHLNGSEGADAGQPIPTEIAPSTAFVELDGIRLEGSNRQAWGAGDDGDATTNASDPGRPDIKSIYMKGIHLELSRQWGTIELPSGKIRGPFLHPYRRQTVWPSPGTLVDVQGFVRWDHAHVEEAGHYCSGWEIHPVSAWRLHASH
jgi:hypothetical protein